MGTWSLRRALLRHILAAVGAFAPGTLLVYGVIQSARDATDSDSLGGFLLDLTVLYPGIAMVAAVGAVVFTIGLAVVRRLTDGATRLTVLLLSPLVLLPWSLFPARTALTWPPALVGVIVGLVLFALLADPGGKPLERQAAV